MSAYRTYRVSRRARQSPEVGCSPPGRRGPAARPPSRRRRHGIAYCRKLSEAGVKVAIVEYIELIHDWMALTPIQNVGGVKASFRHAAADLKHYLG